jgi:hypothetical protein
MEKTSRQRKEGSGCEGYPDDRCMFDICRRQINANALQPGEEASIILLSSGTDFKREKNELMRNLCRPVKTDFFRPPVLLAVGQMSQRYTLGVIYRK